MKGWIHWQRGPRVMVMPLAGTIVTSSVYLCYKNGVWKAVVLRLERALLRPTVP